MADLAERLLVQISAASVSKVIVIWVVCSRSAL